MSLDLNLQPSTKATPTPVLHPLGKSDYKLRIDNSTLDIIKSCPREAEFYLLHRRGRPTSPALNLGSAIHGALEFLYRNGFTNEHLDICYQNIDQHYQAQPIVDDWRTPDFAKRVILEYFQKVGDGPFSLITTKDGNPFVEVAFEIELGEIEINSYLPFSYEHLTGNQYPCPSCGSSNTEPREKETGGDFLYCNDCDVLHPHNSHKTHIRKLKIFIIGKIDLGVHLMNKIWALDHKTTSRLGETFWAKWPLSPQLKTYSWALWKLYDQLPGGAILNVLVVRKPTKTGTAIDFQRQPFTFTQEDLLEWEHNTLLTISNFVAMSLQNSFPPNDANCIRMYGKCPYYDVCELPKPQRLSLLYTAAYAPVTWDPTTEK